MSDSLLAPVQEKSGIGDSVTFESHPMPALIADFDTLAILAVNDTAIRRYGYSVNEFLTMTIKDIPPPEDVQKILQDIRQMSQRPLNGHACRHLTKNGTVFDAEILWHELVFRGHRAIVGFINDITERNRLQDALWWHDQEFKVLVENSPDIISRIDRNLRYRYVNPAAEKIIGIAREKLLGKTKAETKIFPECIYRPWDRKCLEVFSTGRETTHKFNCKTVNGIKHYAIRIVPEFNRNGSVETVLNIVHNVPLEETSNESGNRLGDLTAPVSVREQAFRTAVETASRAKDEFLATLSHELRTPLNAILGWAQTLQLQYGNADKDTLRHALRVIEQSAQTQAKLIDDLLSVSDAISGQLRLSIQPTKLIPAIHAAIESIRPAMTAKKIHFEMALDADNFFIYGDPIRLQQIAWNLLSNAVKFTPSGGLIRIALARADSQIKMTVVDSGEGIDADFLPYVFDRFRQADTSSRRKYGGLGLGLAMVRHLVEMHGGRVHAESPGEGQGAIFSVYFPISPLEQPTDFSTDEEQAPEEADARQRKRLNGLRILSVDDDCNTREILHEALEHAGAEVLSAASARDALNKLSDFRPDILVSDIGMPGEDGYDLLHQVRALPPEQGGATPAMALTGYACEPDRSAICQAGYQACMPKPVNLEELLSTIVSVAGRT